MRLTGILPIVGQVLLLLQGQLAAQSLSAVSLLSVTNSPGEYTPTIVGYDLVGVGWAFTPSEDLIVTDLGKIGGTSRVLFGRVQIWDAMGNVLVGTTNFSNSSIESGIAYGAVSPVLLVAGSPYLIDFVGDGQPVVFNAYFQDSTEPALDFKIAPQLTSFYSGTLLTAGQIDPSSVLTDALYLGPTFKFTTIPEPCSMSVMVLGVAVIGRRRLKKMTNITRNL